MDAISAADFVGGASRRRRQRQLRAFHRHVQMAVKLELATALHHSAQRLEGPREVEEYATYVGPRAQKTPPPGKRPASLAEPQGAQERVQRRTMEQVVGYVRVVPLLDAPVPQMVDKLEDVLKIVDLFVPAQEIEVPKISSPSCFPPRRVLPVPQTTEQLVEVPLPAAGVVQAWVRDANGHVWSRVWDSSRRIFGILPVPVWREVSSHISLRKPGTSRLRGRWIFWFVEQLVNLTCLRMDLFPTNFSVFVVTRKF